MEITKQEKTTIRQPKLIISDECKELLNLIAVGPPYFTLNNLHRIKDDFIASVKTELHLHSEPDNMCISEAGRHLAILGSIVLAYHNPRKEKHYYLATDAYLERTDYRQKNVTEYTTIARLQDINRKIGTIEAQLLSPDGNKVYTATIHYAILHEKIFDRMFKDKRKNFPGKNIKSPYAEQTKLYQLKREPKICTASLGIAKEEHCVGHFNNYPAIPIARLGLALTLFSKEHIDELYGEKNNHLLTKVEIHAESFIFAGEKVDLISQVGETDDANSTLIETFTNTKACCNAVKGKCWFDSNS